MRDKQEEECAARREGAEVFFRQRPKKAKVEKRDIRANPYQVDDPTYEIFGGESRRAGVCSTVGQ